MKGQQIGYIRVSSVDQNTSRQLDGILVDKTFIDKCSGKDTNRPQLKAMLEFARDGDLILVHSMDRLARNLDDLRKIVQQLTTKGIKVRFIKENLEFNGDDSPMAMLLLSVMGAFAEFERNLIRERQLEGVALAKKSGKYKGRINSLNQEQIQDLKQKVAERYKKTELAKEFGISRETLYRYLKSE